MKILNQSNYHRTTLMILLILLGLWFFISFGCAILWREWLDLNAPSVGYAPFGFWMAQQGSIIGFVAILVIYAITMNRLDNRFNKEAHKDNCL